MAELVIQGTLPRPAELEVYLSDTGIFCRSVREGEVVTVGAGAEQPAGTPLYMF